MSLTVEAQETIRQRIQERLAEPGDIDLPSLTDELVDGLTEDDLRTMARPVVHGYARRVISDQRLHEQAASGDPARRAVRSAKWGRAREDANAEVESLLATRWHVRGVYRQLRDLSLEDIEEVEKDYTRRAVELATIAKRFKALKALVKELPAGAGVPDVDPNALVQIFYGGAK